MKTGTALLMVGALQGRLSAGTQDLEASLARAITNLNYQQPTPTNLAAARELFDATLTRSRGLNTLSAEWSRLGFELRETPGGQESLWLLSEPAGKEAGRGWYLFRHARSSLALEAPHARNDTYTGLIALRLFLAGQARVLACSTITRRRADMAHLEDSYFQELTLAFARSCPTGLVVQIHGFESANHDAARAQIIASTGTQSPEPWLTRLVECFRAGTGLTALAYPRDTRQLGATQNAQGQALARTGDCRFLHLEFSHELRERLARDQGLRQTLLDCLSRPSLAGTSRRDLLPGSLVASPRRTKP